MYEDLQALAQLLFCSLNLVFSDVPVHVAVVVFLNSLKKTFTATRTSLNKRFNEVKCCASAKSLYIIFFAALCKGEGKPRQLILFICISNLSLCTGFNFVIALTVINKVNDLRVSRDS